MSVALPYALGEVVADTYRITSIIGRGGMGVVYAARDLKLQRNVALKVSLDERWAGMLHNEALALASVRHPGVVTIHAVGSHADREYLVMERLVGRTLQAHIDEQLRKGRPFQVDEILELLIGVADALSAVHATGLAHRDLKPGNVMVCGARTVLLDFGLFVPEYEAGHDDTVAGSAEYMAPEVIARRVAPGAGPLVDLYAFGVIAFELLTGQTPFRAGTATRILTDHLSKPPPALLRDDAPRLVRLVEELLEKDPADRPGSAEAVLWQLCAMRSPQGAHAGVRPFHVLVVDDDPQIATVLRRTLKAAMPQLVVESETDPRVALREIEREPPDLVILDLNMPEMNGVELAMAISTLPHPTSARARLVGMSAEATDGDVAVMRAVGVTDFVPKDERFVGHVANVVAAIRNGAHAALR